MTDPSSLPMQLREGFKELYAKIEDLTRHREMLYRSDESRIERLETELRDRFKQLDHERDRKHEFWSGFGFGIIVGIGAVLIIFLLEHGIKS